AKTNVKSIHSSKGIGEPPLLLGNTVFFAIRNAITAARKCNNNNTPVVLRLPATPERIRIACDDEIVRKCKVEKKDDEVPWESPPTGHTSLPLTQDPLRFPGTIADPCETSLKQLPN
ncbi:14446_t:CDS:2, partial [Dentiscutata heterogama]